MSFRGQTVLTFTHDPALLDPSDAARLVQMTGDRLDEAVQILNG